MSIERPLWQAQAYDRETGERHGPIWIAENHIQAWQLAAKAVEKMTVEQLAELGIRPKYFLGLSRVGEKPRKKSNENK